MAQSRVEEVRDRALIFVLKSLGEKTFSLMNNYLMNQHGIFLHEGHYSLEKLRHALDDLVGEKSAQVLFELAFVKMDELSSSNDVLAV